MAKKRSNIKTIERKPCDCDIPLKNNIAEKTRKFFVYILVMTTICGIYAFLYHQMSKDGTDFTDFTSFTDAMYFSLTVVSTTGFGDVAPKSDFGRKVVSTQIYFTWIFALYVTSVLI